MRADDPAGVRIQLLDNRDISLRSALDRALSSATRLDVAVAFARVSGLRTISTLKDFARSRGPVRLLAGTDFAQTELRVLDDLSECGAKCRVYTERYARFGSGDRLPTFHPKVYLAQSDDSAVAIVGSSNFTAGGLLANHEANVSLESRVDAPEVQAIRNYFETYWNSPYAIEVDSQFRVNYGKAVAERHQVERQYGDRVAALTDGQRLRLHLGSMVTRRVAEIAHFPRPTVLITSPGNYRICGLHQIWGDVDERRIARLRPGEPVLFYIKGEKAVGGLALVGGRPRRLERSYWPDREYTHAVDLQFLMPPDITVPIEPLVPVLDFITNKRAWGTHLQGFCREIAWADFERLHEALVLAGRNDLDLRVADADRR